jgi:putative flippase GtrA
MEYILSINSSHHAKTFARFCMVGVMNTCVDMLAYFVLTRFAGLSGFLVVAKACSYLLATLNSLYFNHTWTFERTDPITARIITRYFCTVGLGIFINVGIHWFDVRIVYMPDLLSVLVAAAGTILWGFAWSRFFVFKV